MNTHDDDDEGTDGILNLARMLGINVAVISLDGDTPTVHTYNPDMDTQRHADARDDDAHDDAQGIDGDARFGSARAGDDDFDDKMQEIRDSAHLFTVYVGIVGGNRVVRDHFTRCRDHGELLLETLCEVVRAQLHEQVDESGYLAIDVHAAGLAARKLDVSDVPHALERATLPTTKSA
jgi:hypothetical protein